MERRALGPSRLVGQVGKGIQSSPSGQRVHEPRIERFSEAPEDCLNAKSSEEHEGVTKAELSCEADSENYPRRLLRDFMYYIGLDVHKKTISYCVKDAAGKIHQ